MSLSQAKKYVENFAKGNWKYNDVVKKSLNRFDPSKSFLF